MTSLPIQILRASEGVIYQAISRFQPEWAGAASAGVSAALSYVQTVSPYFSRCLNMNQIFMGTMNASWLAWDRETLSEALQQRQISQIAKEVLLMSTVVGSVYLHFAGNWLHQKMYPPEPLLDHFGADRATLSYAPQNLQSYGQAVILTRAIMNLAITWLSPQHRVWAGLNVAGLSYSYLKNAQIKWLKFSCALDYPPVDPGSRAPNKCYPKKLRCDYEFPLFPNQGQGTECVICMGGDPPFDACPPHAPCHMACWTDAIYAALKKCQGQFKMSFSVDRYDVAGPSIFMNYRAHLKALESHFPSCITCQGRSDFHTLNVQYFDQDETRRPFTTTLEWLHDPCVRPVKYANIDSLWARLGAIGSVAHAVLATMQERHPDIAGKIATARRYFILFDLGAIAHHYWQLYRLLYEKYVVIKARKDTPRDLAIGAADSEHLSLQKYYHERLKAVMIVGGIALAAISVLTVHALHKKCPLIVDLTEVLKKVALPEDFKNMKINGDMITLWEPQCLILHRIFLNVILMFFSPDRRSYGLSVFAQAMTLWQGPSRELVVRLQRTHTYPISNVVASFRVRVPLRPLTGCRSLSSHLEQHMKAVYDYTTQLLQGSAWRQVLSTPTRQTYWYSFNQALKASPLASCACSLAGVVESATH